MADRWYVAAYPRPDITKQDRVWTVSRNPDEPGWITDGSYDGYGLTWADATELMEAANAAWQRKTKRG